jgi:hypothetical protein
MQVIDPVVDPSLTTGFFKTEEEATQALIDSLGGLFRVYPQIEGRYQFFKHSRNLSYPIIDLILVPNPELKEAGWSWGPVGIEVKASGKKLGPALSQLIDYSTAAYPIHQTWIVPDFFFLFPANRFKGPLESILAHLRCGGIYRDPYGQLIFHSTNIIARLSEAHGIDIRPNNTNHGHKVGSR